VSDRKIECIRGTSIETHARIKIRDEGSTETHSMMVE
jgi:hypothetical protein